MSDALERRKEISRRIERALYNSILASQDPQTGMSYFQATGPGYVKLYCTPTDHVWCCTGSCNMPTEVPPLARSTQIELAPWHRIAHERYTLYWRT